MSDVESFFGLRLRTERIRAGMRQEDLAERMTDAGVTLHPSAIAKIESGRRAVRLREAVAIAAALHMPLAGLLTPPPEADWTDWQRGYRACSDRVLRALSEVSTLLITDPADDPYEINLSSCPYYQTRGLPDAQRGLCSHGCRDEPECQTCEPVGGWPPLPADPEEDQ